MVKHAPDTNPKKLRSHAGCARCKRRRQKCDERKPLCGRCSDAGISCEYSVLLRWGGRTFDRSRFGACLKQHVKKIENTTDGFVYAASCRPPPISKDGVGPPLREIDMLPALSITERSLLSHFARDASRVTCAHAGVQIELCQLILPMSLSSPALLYATLAWSAIQSVASHGSIDGTSDPSGLIAALKARSIRSLRLELQEEDAGKGDVLLATVRTLCQCEIHSGSDGESKWRVHVRGAKALMGRGEKSRGGMSRLLERWFKSLESLAALTPLSQARDEDLVSGEIEEEDEDESVYLDDYNGCSTDLSCILGKIGAAAKLQDQRQGLTSSATREECADELEEAVHVIMERDNTRTPVFYPGVSSKLSPIEITEYSLCNEAYQHTALIHIARRLRNLPSQNPSIQHSVKRIIECVTGIRIVCGLSPVIVLTTPLFTAGCEALGDDRRVIGELLGSLYGVLKIRNIGVALEYLAGLWAEDGNDEDSKSVLSSRANNPSGQKNWDFIPY